MELVTEPAVLVLVGSCRSAGMFACSLLRRRLLPAGLRVSRQGQPCAWHGVSSCCSSPRNSLHMDPHHTLPPQDEPTSGLDSFTALNLMRTMKQVRGLRPVQHSCYSAAAACLAELLQCSCGLQSKGVTAAHACMVLQPGAQPGHASLPHRCCSSCATCHMLTPHSHPSRAHRWPAAAAL